MHFLKLFCNFLQSSQLDKNMHWESVLCCSLLDTPVLVCNVRVVQWGYNLERIPQHSIDCFSSIKLYRCDSHSQKKSFESIFRTLHWLVIIFIQISREQMMPGALATWQFCMVLWVHLFSGLWRYSSKHTLLLLPNKWVISCFIIQIWY